MNEVILRDASPKHKVHHHALMAWTVWKSGVPCSEELGERRDCVISMGDQTSYFQQWYLVYCNFIFWVFWGLRPYRSIFFSCIHYKAKDLPALSWIHLTTHLYNCFVLGWKSGQAIIACITLGKHCQTMAPVTNLACTLFL